MVRKILTLIFLLVTTTAFAQRKQGSWQNYLSFSSANKIAVAPDKIFCATNGGLFYYDLQDKSVNKVSDIVKMSDFGIKTIAYSAENEVLVVAYTNSNIDLVYSSNVVNLSDIKRKQISGDKTINNITFIGKEAWLSCGFGIVVINLDKKEIKDTYLPGSEGNFLEINDVESDGNIVYAATGEGVLKSLLTSNLADFRNWSKIDNIPYYTERFSLLARHAGSIIATYAPGEYDGDRMFILNNGTWSNYHHEIGYLSDMQNSGSSLVITGREYVYVINNTHTTVLSLNSYKFGNTTVSPISPSSAAFSENGFLFIADKKNTLVKATGQTFEMIYPMGPIDNQMFALTISGTDLWIASGGRTDSWNNAFQLPRFQRFGNGEWTYYNKLNNTEMDGFFDIIQVTVDPKNPEHFFAASWGGGLLEYVDGNFRNRYNNKNSPLQTAIPSNPDAPYVRIGGTVFDSKGTLWITNSEVAQNLHSLSPDGKWSSFTLPEVANSYNIGQIVVTQSDDKWIVLPRGQNAYVVNKTGEQKERLPVISYFNNGQQEIFNAMNDIYSIAVDNDGAIWMGTSKGVAVYNSPSRIWASEPLYAMQPSLDLNDGIYHPLLENETVTAIAIDGANRKWLGTKNSGVYLVSDNGTKEILHFNTTNSPLISDNINSIAVNQKNGEIFIGTDKGLISYMGDAIQGADTYNNVYVYPNPVRETYDGPVTITGLIENSEVKITDIAGNLVFRTESLGGQAVWDGRNLNGNRVKTGVYLVLCNDANGETTHITKLLFIH